MHTLIKTIASHKTGHDDRKKYFNMQLGEKHRSGGHQYKIL